MMVKKYLFSPIFCNRPYTLSFSTNIHSSCAYTPELAVKEKNHITLMRNLGSSIKLIRMSGKSRQTRLWLNL
jgi:hypothetical protein